MKFVNLKFMDLIRPRSLEVPFEEYKTKKGFWFDGSSVAGFKKVENSDLLLLPDESTFSPLPWKESVSEVICNTYTSQKKPFEKCPRNILCQTIENLEELGIKPRIGVEMEFYLIDGDIEPIDRASYFELEPVDSRAEFRRELARNLKKMGIEVVTSHHEVGEGQQELGIKCGGAVETADNIISFKQATKELANSNDLLATFMPKPFAEAPGNGMHLHLSLDKDGKNLFSNEGELSEEARYFIGGVLKHIQSLSLVLAPTVNSCKRLGGDEAPTSLNWGYSNRSSLIRIPGDENRLEIRCVDPACNPYLAFSAILKAGFEGIKKKIAPGSPIKKSAYGLENQKRLPRSLGEAIENAKNDTTLSEFFPSIYDDLIRLKEREWEVYLKSTENQGGITDWEIERYLEKA